MSTLLQKPAGRLVAVCTMLGSVGLTMVTAGSAAGDAAPRQPVTAQAPYVNWRLDDGTPTVGYTEDTVVDFVGTPGLAMHPLNEAVFVVGDEHQSTVPTDESWQQYAEAGSSAWSVPIDEEAQTNLVGLSMVDLDVEDFAFSEFEGPLDLALDARGSGGVAEAPGVVIAGANGTESDYVSAYLSNAPAGPEVANLVPAFSLPTAWTFTQPGGYCVDLVMTGDLADGSTVTWPTATVAVAVGEETDPASVVCGDEAVAPVASTTTVTVDGAERYGAPGRAEVQVAAAGAPAAGTVEVSVDGKALGAADLVGGSASVALPAGLRAGRHTVTAAYAGTATGDAPVAASSGAHTWRIGTATSRTRLTGSGSTNRITTRVDRRPVVRIAVRLPGSAATPAGRVTIRQGGAVLRRLSLTQRDSGVQKTRLPAFKKPGRYRLVAVYAGTADIAGSRSDRLRVVVARAARS